MVLSTCGQWVLIMQRPPPWAVGQYRSPASQEPSCTAGGEWRGSERSHRRLGSGSAADPRALDARGSAGPWCHRGWGPGHRRASLQQSYFFTERLVRGPSNYHRWSVSLRLGPERLRAGSQTAALARAPSDPGKKSRGRLARGVMAVLIFK